MSSPLDLLLEEGIITDVVGRLQSGKEAEVFLVRYGERIVAAKVYKDKSQRSFKNKSAYQEGRAVRNTRDQRAMDRRSRFGKGAEEDAWKSAEADALYRLHAAEVRVPTPVLFFEGVLLMELVVDASGVTARRLIDTTLSVEDANAAYHDMLTQLVRMLACDLIHGDLSPYNVLWGAGGATIIDFPQIVSAAQNSNSERFFLRDAENILGYFRAVDARLNARRSDAAEIWRAYMRRELSADFVPTGKVTSPPAQRPLLLPAQRPVTGHAQRPQTSGGDGPRPQGKRFDPPRAPVGNQRANGPSQPTRGNGPSQPTRGNGPSQPTRGNGPSQPTRGNGPSQPTRGNASQPAGRNFGKARRVPEVIVRPRAAERQAPSEPSGSEKRDPAAASRARRVP